MVDAWRAVIGAQAHLAQWFVGPDGNPDNEYKARAKRRFVQWVVDVAARTHDQAWLDYREEIGLRHTPQKKNKTDDRHTPTNVPLRYLIAFVPVVTDIRQFLAAVIEGAAELAAWRAHGRRPCICTSRCGLVPMRKRGCGSNREKQI